MNSSPLPSAERASHSMYRGNFRQDDVTFTDVTEQFKFMRVGGNNNGKGNDEEEELAKYFMTKLGINATGANYSEQLAALTKELSGMMVPSASANQANPHQSNDRVDDKIPKTSDSSSNLSKKNPLRGRSPERSRSKSPIGTIFKKTVDGIRSRSPFRRNKDGSPYPITGSKENSTDNAYIDETFFESHQTEDSFMTASPKPGQNPLRYGGNTEQGQPPTPSTSGRPPLVSVHISQAKMDHSNPPVMSPQWQSSFKFDKDHDKFNIGSSPPKNRKSPEKKIKSSPRTHGAHHPDISPLQGSPLTEAGTPTTEQTPSPFCLPKKTQVNITHTSSQVISDAPPMFASPVPEFHPPDTFVRSSGTRGIPTPHNIMHNDQKTEAATFCHTGPPNVATTTATVSDSFDKTTSREPKTPFVECEDVNTISNTAPDTVDTAETCIKKKTRNTATPNLDACNQMFNVDLSSNTSKPIGTRGNTLRKGFNFGKTTGFSNHVFGLGDIKEVGTDDTAPTAPTTTESPSNNSAISMDTSPLFSPPAQQSQQSNKNDGIGTSQKFGGQAQFSLGVGDNHVSYRSKRKENKGRRTQSQQSQNGHVSGPARSAFDFHMNQKTNREKELLALRSEIIALKEEGKASYLNAKYQESTRLYSEAIQTYKHKLFAHVPAKDLLAVLLSNRAAALLMIGAYESAAEDCRNAIHFVTDPRNTNPNLVSPDANPVLRPKLYTRMARSYLKLGRVDDADSAFSEAIESATVIQDFHRRKNIIGPYDELENIKTEAVLAQTDASQLRKLMGKIDRLLKERSLNPSSARTKVMECLFAVKTALISADGCHDLHQMKVNILCELKRWREITSHCERFAASNVKYDGCLVGDLSSKNPFPDVPVAKSLRSNYFGDSKEDDLKGAEMILGRNAAAEALLRLPISMMPYYLRSLRLNERYLVAETCISKLDKYIADRSKATVDAASIYRNFLWLSAEREKLKRTENSRGKADTMFSNADYENAARKYAECLAIDSDGQSSCAGGRLHAILHCNRAACFMALKRYRDALNECTAALRIYPRYLKALLRRARCYSRLNRTSDGKHDYKHWLEIVNNANESNAVLGDCVFDGPHTVKSKDKEDVQAELNDLLEAEAREEAQERIRETRKRYEEQSRKFHSERSSYNNGKKSPVHEDAHRRRENFYSNQNSSRRWDSFKDDSYHRRQKKKSPYKKKKNNKTEYGYNGGKHDNDGGGYGSKTRDGSRSPRDSNNHYIALGIDRNATIEEIKKAYKKMALKYHPDKNKDNPTAAENFLRIKDAYEILKDQGARRKYDSEIRRGRY
eukprot:CAMPEP_0197182448 /NCGR_PEP_ID=MMETSP1423-20130617/6397_1 /TAXON_ID=476441 /ORGANISM="Pseudo-nitzschia heimii, Strain UNC1101" /LENGTH=1310 /DNA_ID=CAMNT_0042632869 /DNA_START=73 /DNA_END=4005 /DNA_ORIENTATION=-